MSPTEEEIELVVNSIDVNQDFIRDALDDEEKPRIDVEEADPYNY